MIVGQDVAMTSRRRFTPAFIVAAALVLAACGGSSDEGAADTVDTVHAVDAEKGLILLKGAVPGPRGGLVVIRSAAKKTQEV